MNKFSELQATDLELELVIQPIGDHGWPCVTVEIQDQKIWDGRLTQTLCYRGQWPLLDPIGISITLRDKVYQSAPGDTAVRLQKLDIDGLAVIPTYAHLAQYHNDHGQGRATDYLGFNGQWSLHIPRPFYQWWHEITGQGWLLKPH